MDSYGKTSATGVAAVPGHLRFFGGTLVATYNVRSACARSVCASSCSLWPSP
jgi:hypothetical protein